MGKEKPKAMDNKKNDKKRENPNAKESLLKFTNDYNIIFGDTKRDESVIEYTGEGSSFKMFSLLDETPTTSTSNPI